MITSVQERVIAVKYARRQSINMRDKGGYRLVATLISDLGSSSLKCHCVAVFAAKFASQVVAVKPPRIGPHAPIASRFQDDRGRRFRASRAAACGVLRVCCEASSLLEEDESSARLTRGALFSRDA